VLLVKKLSKRALLLSDIELVGLLAAGSGACVPKGEDFTAGMKGNDSDSNGIGDDIDELILQKYADTPTIKNAAEKYARTVQVFMEANTKQEAYQAAKESGNMVDCIVHIILPGNNIENYKKRGQLIDEIVAYTANTRERFEKYWSSSKMIGGASFQIEKKPICD